MTDKQGYKNADSVFKTETRFVRIYRREYQLPVFLGDSFQQQHRDIRQRCQLVKEGRPTFLGLGRKPLSVDERIEILNNLMTDYESIIHFIQTQKTFYTQFFADLIGEIKDITTEKCQKIADLEQKRTTLVKQAGQNQDLQLIYSNQQSQLLKAAQLIGCASLLMLKKLELIQGALAKLADDHEVQRQVFDEMLGHLNIYTETHRLQKEIADIQQEAADMAKTAIDFDKYVGNYLGSLQGFISEVVKIDQKLSIALEEIQGLTDVILGESEMSLIDSDKGMSEKLMSWLTQSALKEDRLTDALQDVEQQTLSAAEMELQLLLSHTQSDSVQETLTKIQAHLEPVFNQLILFTSPGQTPLSNPANSSFIVESDKKIQIPTPVSTTRLKIVRPSQTDNLSSEKGVDYTRLRDLLKAGQWFEADKETFALLLKASGRKQEGWLGYESIKNFPCTDLRTIDQLWVKYSNGRFGFSVQKRIWKRVGKDLDKFGDRVGWRKGWWMNKEWIDFSKVTYDTTTPGHLPFMYTLNEILSANSSPSSESDKKFQILTPVYTTPIQIVQPSQTDDLSSEKGVDYTRLRDLLKARQWFEADYETYLVMLQAVGRTHDDYIRREELLNFPCTDLRTINCLWVKYSDGHFGFSVQKQIYLEVGGLPDGKYYKEAWEKFGDRVGWRVKKSWIDFVDFDKIHNLCAPVGHLPVVNFRFTGGGGSTSSFGCVWVASLLSHQDLR